MSYVATYFAGSTDPTAATPVDLTVGHDAVGINIRLNKVEVYRVSGSLAGILGDAPLTHIRVSVVPRDSSRVFVLDAGTSVAKDGTFELTGIQPGTYELMAISAEGATQILAQQPLEVGKQNVDGVTLTVQPPADLPGRIRIDTAQHPITTAPPIVGMRIGLMPSDDGFAYTYPHTSVKNDGSFTLSNVVSGKYQFNLSAMPDGLYLKSAKFGDQDVSNGEFEFGGRGELELVLRAGAGQITGSVQDEKQHPAIGSIVTLIPDPPQPDRTDLYKVATTVPLRSSG